MSVPIRNSGAGKPARAELRNKLVKSQNVAFNNTNGFIDDSLRIRKIRHVDIIAWGISMDNIAVVLLWLCCFIFSRKS